MPADMNNYFNRNNRENRPPEKPEFVKNIGDKSGILSSPDSIWSSLFY